MKKRPLLLAVFFFWLSLFAPFAAYSQDSSKFTTDLSVTYEVGESGTTTIYEKVTLTNNSSDYYAKSYSLEFKGVTVTNPTAWDANGQVLKTENITGDNGVTGVKVDFAAPVVGKGNSRVFTIQFQDTSITQKIGEVWEITIPKLSSTESFSNYQAVLKVPASFGNLAYMSPKPNESTADNGLRVYTFSKDTVSQNGVSSAFGEFQVFSFDLSYHLENPLKKDAKTAISIPPDTAYQKVIYKKLDPAPSAVTVDEDGNWLATYTLAPRERLDVRALGSVQIFAQPRAFIKPDNTTLDRDLMPQPYWEVADPELSALAKSLATPRAIYDYVVTHLKYSYDRVQPNIDRFGAKKASQNPNQAICMEFTDLFITLARAAGIPAREVNGFAYTENPEIQPLSLVSDVLHSWPEYWDSEKQIWVPVDPTWGETSGVDYFANFDLRHFTFAIHGADSQKPYPAGSYKLGANPQKDVYVSFGELPLERQSTPKLTITPVSNPLHPLTLKYTVLVENPGPVALYNLNLNTLFDGKDAQKFTVDILPPFATKEETIAIPFTFLGSKTPDSVTVVIGTQKVTTQTHRKLITIASLASVLALIFALTLLIYLKVYAKKAKGRKEES